MTLVFGHGAVFAREAEVAAEALPMGLHNSYFSRHSWGAGPLLAKTWRML